jgi:hypothetical protein
MLLRLNAIGLKVSEKVMPEKLFHCRRFLLQR